LALSCNSAPIQTLLSLTYSFIIRLRDQTRDSQ
jgi:hypothetical protein